MERYRANIAMLIICAFLSAGCAPTLSTRNVRDPYLIADYRQMDNTFILGVYWANERKLKEEGGKNRRSWLFVAIDNSGKIDKFLATDYELWDFESCRKKLLIFIPGVDQVGKLGGIVNRAGLKMYNNLGEERWIKNPYGKVKYSDYVGYLSVIDPASQYFLLIKKDSAEYQKLDNTIRTNAIFQYVYFKTYVQKKANKLYGVPLGTMVPDWVLDRMAAEDDIVKSFAAWAGSGWKAYLSVPFIGVANTFIQAGLFKLMDIPNIYSMVEKEGFATHHPNMSGVVDAIEQAEPFQACRDARRTDIAVDRATEQLMKEINQLKQELGKK
jgi:hypothetical protein